jgi:ubiquinone/menaquinone biosynthesis C-methylase UbiE
MAVVEASDEHDRQVVEQFSRQAVYFAKLPGHEDATQLLLRMGEVGPDHEVLDVACGAGAVACAAARIARQVTGIDLTPAMIERARFAQAEASLSNVVWHIGDVGQLPFPAAAFDMAVTRYSLHHFFRPEVVLAEMIRVCKPRGRVVVADLLLPPEKAGVYDRMERLRDPSHVRVLSESELLGLLACQCRTRERAVGGLPVRVTLDQLMEASFPDPGNAKLVRELIEADVGADKLGIRVHRLGEVVRFAYPVTVAAGMKPG